MSKFLNSHSVLLHYTRGSLKMVLHSMRVHYSWYTSALTIISWRDTRPCCWRQRASHRPCQVARSDARQLSYTFDKHENGLSKMCFDHIRAFWHIRPAVDEDMAQLVACSLVGSRLDFANAALFGVSKHNIRRLQCIQNSVARVHGCPIRQISSSGANLISVYAPYRSSVNRPTS